MSLESVDETFIENHENEDSIVYTQYYLNYDETSFILMTIVGPVMLLEICEGGTMRDWLVNMQTQVTDDTMEKLFRYAYDIARGMEYLAEKQVNII